jgi:N-acetylmuramoyl-L-alanine amidase
MSKKILKLTESELIKTIKKIISEQVKIVTTHDKSFDYKREGDKFYFKGKGNYASKYPNWTLAKSKESINAIRTKVFGLKPVIDLVPIKPVEPAVGAIIKPPTEPSTSEASSLGLSRNDLIVAATIWGEARGEGEEGMIAVANVIRNRAESNGVSPKDVVLKPKQFSVWNNTDVDSELSRIKNLYKKNPNSIDSKMWDLAKKITLNYVKNEGSDITKGSEFYHTKSIKPSWASKLEYTTTIGNHKFYRKSV